MSINLIAAVGLNGELGQTSSPDGLPWSNPEDLKFFKSTTETHTVLMGRKTFDSIPFADGFPRRKNLILSCNGEYLGKRCLQLRNCPEFLDYVRQRPEEEIFIIGGKSIYDQLHQYCDKVYLTRINQEFPDADVIMDLSWLDNFELVDRLPLNDYSEVEVYTRK